MALETEAKYKQGLNIYIARYGELINTLISKTNKDPDQVTPSLSSGSCKMFMLAANYLDGEIEKTQQNYNMNFAYSARVLFKVDVFLSTRRIPMEVLEILQKVLLELKDYYRPEVNSFGSLENMVVFTSFIGILNFYVDILTTNLGAPLPLLHFFYILLGSPKEIRAMSQIYRLSVVQNLDALRHNVIDTTYVNAIDTLVNNIFQVIFNQRIYHSFNITFYRNQRCLELNLFYPTKTLKADRAKFTESIEKLIPCFTAINTVLNSKDDYLSTEDVRFAKENLLNATKIIFFTE